MSDAGPTDDRSAEVPLASSWGNWILFLCAIPLGVIGFFALAKPLGPGPHVTAFFGPLNIRLGLLSIFLTLGDVALCVSLGRRASQDLAHLNRGMRVAFRAAQLVIVATLLIQGWLLFSLVLAVPDYLVGQPVPGLSAVIFLPWSWSLWAVGKSLWRQPKEQAPDVSGALLEREIHAALYERIARIAKSVRLEAPSRIVVVNTPFLEMTTVPVRVAGEIIESPVLFVPNFVFRHLPEDLFDAAVAVELIRARELETDKRREYARTWAQVSGMTAALAQSGGVGLPGLLYLRILGDIFGPAQDRFFREHEVAVLRMMAAELGAETVARATVFFKFLQLVHATAQNLASFSEEPSTLHFEEAERACLQEPELGHLVLGFPVAVAPRTGLRVSDHLQILGTEMAAPDVLPLIISGQRKPAIALEVADFGIAKLRVREQEDVIRENAQLQVLREPREKLRGVFPTREYRYGQRSPVVGAGVTLLIGAALVALMILFPGHDDKGRPAEVAMGVFGFGAFILGMAIYIFRHRWFRILLDAEGVRFGSWPQPLAFDRVRRIFLRRAFGQVLLIFDLSDAQAHPFAPSWKRWLFPRTTMQMNLWGYQENPEEIVKTIFRYYYKQVEN